MFPIAAKAPFHHIGVLAVRYGDVNQAYGLFFRATAGTGDPFLGARAGQQLIDHLVRQQRLDFVGEFGAGSGRARSASAALRSPSGLATRHAGALVWVLVLVHPA